MKICKNCNIEYKSKRHLCPQCEKEYDNLRYIKRMQNPIEKEKLRQRNIKYSEEYKINPKLRKAHGISLKKYQTSQPEKYLWSRAKTRAKKKNLEFNIEIENIIIPDICPILGIVLQKGNNKFCDSSPTLDRIDNSKGYIKGNIQVISFRANTIKGSSSNEELKIYLKNYLSYLENNQRIDKN